MISDFPFQKTIFDFERLRQILLSGFDYKNVMLKVLALGSYFVNLAFHKFS